jgi:putative ABC transport system permease protein
MIKNYFMIAFRNIKRYYTHSILNISGMTIGMVCAFLISLWVQNQWSYDRHFEHADNLYRVIEKQNLSGGDASFLAATPGLLASTLKEEYPEIIRSTRYSNPPITLQKGNDVIEPKVALVDPDFFKMFDVVFVQGDSNHAFNGPQNIVITEETAHKYYGNDDPIGKTLQMPGFPFVLTITGVVKGLPQNSHIQFDILFSTEFLAKLGGPIHDWKYRCYNYIELKKGTDCKRFEEKILDFEKKHQDGSNSEILLQNIKKIHLFSSRKYLYDISGHGDITYVRIMGLVAIFILLITCINVMNLSTAQAVRRTREIGVRKVVGANKRTIFLQFLGESLVTVLIALILSLILVELLLPGYGKLIGIQLVVNSESVGFYIGLIFMVLFFGLLAGSYPAFYLSTLKPQNIIRGIINKKPGITRFRRALVISQFSLSILLIICTFVVESQFNYMKNKKLGFNKDNIGYFQFPSAPWDAQLKTLKKELSNNPEILSVTSARYNPFNMEGTSDNYSWVGKKADDDVLFYILSADADYAKTFQLELKKGRFLSSEFSTDAAAVVINEQAAKAMGFENPIGEILTTREGSKVTIVGVVKDFHFKSLHSQIEPLIMQMGESNNFFLRMKPNHILSTVESVKKLYESFHPMLPLAFHFLDSDYDKLYQTEQRMGQILGYFSLLAILISCLGLIGLSLFMTELRTKEIGVRKVNGANPMELFCLLSKEYVLWVLISIVIASPIAWCIMNKWLENFAYKTEQSWWIFAIAGLLSLSIALLAIGWQSWKAATSNPVDALRNE